ncbi:alkaline phosphatase D family protein [Calothrix sp. CCY 0018]|uniref:alkaline phosphatase D family protein n=1 Tax=Calothrix sp. CCY 0018 TaxID=3103864 RepID=UPI0039C709BF
MKPKPLQNISRRRFLLSSTIATIGIIATNFLQNKSFAQAPAIITSDKMRPKIPYGVASGDVNANSAVIWSRSDKPARMIVDYATNESFKNARRVIGPAALEVSDFTARVNLNNLPTGEQVFYRVVFQDLADINTYSAPYTGNLRTPAQNDDIFFAWSGDTAGQGWGINPDFGGMKIYETIRQLKPDFFIHSGDYIYADGPIESTVKLDDGSIWKNIVTPEKSKVAETLQEFRGNYVYNLLDENVKRFNAEVPQLVQWDDHETVNNWYPGKMLDDDDRYKVKSVSLLAARAKQAFMEYTPIRFDDNDPEQIYRSYKYGSNLEVFMLDERSYRGPNTANRQQQASAETAFLGNSQVRWLKNQLLYSKATWKVIASDMPIGLLVKDGETKFENASNGNGEPLGRELEIADLLRFIKQKNIRNVVWLTADVHYAAAHYYDPNKAQFSEFTPFWEFVAGPLNSGTFGPNQLDNTFGPQVKFQSVDSTIKPNRSPKDNLQFFGTVKINSQTKVMSVALHNLEGKTLYSVDLPAS